MLQSGVGLELNYVWSLFVESAKFEKHEGETSQWVSAERVRHGSGTMTYLFSFMFEFLTFLFINLGFIVPLKLKTRTFVVPGGPRHGSAGGRRLPKNILIHIPHCSHMAANCNTSQL